MQGLMRILGFALNEVMSPPLVSTSKLHGLFPQWGEQSV